jgi:hypothetical protein
MGGEGWSSLGRQIEADRGTAGAVTIGKAERFEKGFGWGRGEQSSPGPAAYPTLRTGEAPHIRR